MIQMVKIAYRNLGRNRRRSFFSALGLALGLALLLLMASFIRGEISSALDYTILLQSGHLQIRAPSYEESKTSLKWDDLIEDPQTLAAQVAALPQVLDATPRLYATAILVSQNKSVGVRVFGIDPQAKANQPYREGLVSGQFLSPDDREGLLLGQSLAQKLGLQAGDRVNLSVNTANGDVDEQIFIVRGIFSTGTNAFDNATILLPLSKAQAITQADNHASVIFILLKDKRYTDNIADSLSHLPYKVLTWRTMNDIIIQTEDMANAYMVIFYLIVLAITASVIVNTLIMAVFERMREIGILAALGWRAKEILLLFLAETAILTVGGILLGLIIGLLAVTYFSTHGFYIGNMGISGFLIGNMIYTELTLSDTIRLTLITFIITIIAGLYPAILAARLEPVRALRGAQ